MTRYTPRQSPPQWPNGARCAACLTFDLDGEAVWTSKIPQDPAFGSATVRSMGRFGPATAMPRILDLLEQYAIRAGFFVVGMVAEEYPELICDIHGRGHEIAHHSYSHTSPARLGPEQTRADFEKAQDVLTRLTGSAPRGFRSPAADVTEACWDFLLESGFAYDSSLMTGEHPYLLGVRDTRLVELPFHWLLDDWVHFGFNMYPSLPYMSGISSQENVLEIWTEEFNGIYDAGGLYMLVMHPQVIGRLSRLRMLARLIEHMQSNEGVWFATPLDVATFWAEQHPEGVDEIVLAPRSRER